ncbi:MAG: lactate utilization protein [Heliobacteriaceae bacterium]|nr:lactate utilization protein [Heliobacteriaceae bacterium]
MSLADTLRDWNYEQKCREAVAALEKNRFKAVYCPEKQAAVDYILKEAAAAKTVGFGGSLSVPELNVAAALTEMGKELFDHGARNLSPEERLAVMRRQLTCDLFLTGTNALTLTGYLVNMDATGNRVASMIFGPQKTIVVAGRNKLVSDPAEALKRIKTGVAPLNAKRLRCKTPCTETGFCADCNSPQRICGVTSIMERKPWFSDIHVLVVNADLGL